VFITTYSIPKKEIKVSGKITMEPSPYLNKKGLPKLAALFNYL
jgi:hypothetical protein